VSGVKQSIIISALATIAITSVSGCSSLELSRFAPPGIVKYEEIAGDKPPNPAIEERIRERKKTVDSEFPVLSRTPGKKDRPRPRDETERQADLAELDEARDALESDIAADRAAMEDDRKEQESLFVQRDDLSTDLERDAKAAQKERKSPTPGDKKD